MQSWQGQTIDDLFRTWGRPVYQADALRVYDPRMTDAWPIYRIFFADSTGHIVRSQWRGRWECCSR